ncbi:hypothetical protein ABFX02_08G145900 [Erythranthe guttata]
MKHKFLKYFFLVIFSTTFFDVSHAKSISETLNFNQALNATHQWRSPAQFVNPTPQFLLAGALSFIAAAISSAGGLGGGGLFVPILTIVAGLDLKTASTYSAFMVTGGSIANVACQMLARRGGGAPPLIDYDTALLSEPCMLLGVSLGVIFNVVLPEWLITVFFAIFLAFCTFKTCKSGVWFWGIESEGMRRNRSIKIEIDERSIEQPLLCNEVGKEEKLGVPLPWMKLGLLLLIWFSFFLLYLLRGNRYGQGIINIESCGTGYWIISSIQIPLAIIFTFVILNSRKSRKNTASNTPQENGECETRNGLNGKLVFPLMALLAGILGGVFGIGGGMLISPLLIQIGMQPEVTAATCSFMVLFSSSMSAIQYLLLGMDYIYGALILSAVCFVASLIGLTLVQRAVMKHGRASLIVFSVGTVMALSTVLMTSFGAVAVWSDYTSGKSMGFKKPC